MVLGGGCEQSPTSYFTHYLLQCLKQNDSLSSPSFVMISIKDDSAACFKKEEKEALVNSC